MSSRESSLKRLQAFNLSLGDGDRELAEEAADRRVKTPELEGISGEQSVDHDIVEESIVLRRFRPVMRIIDDTTEVAFREQEDSEIWKGRIEAAKEQLDRAITSIGRINLEGAPFDWVGTGWLVRDNIMVTNRHVADEFVKSAGASFTFHSDGGEQIGAEIDFLQEFDRSATRAFSLVKPLYVVPRPGPDIAFFEVEATSGDGKLGTPIKLAKKLRTTQSVAVIGYPAYDSRIPDIELMEQIYGRKYNKKRLAPGAVTDVQETRLLHNCTTLGGNSGSSVIDLETGEVFGLHFSGSFLRSNYAVRADVVGKILDDVMNGRRPYAERSQLTPAASTPRSMSPQHATASPTASAAQALPGQQSVSMTLPLTISVSLGQPVAASLLQPHLIQGQPTAPAILHDDDDIEIDNEARPEDYLDRKGFSADFIKGAHGLHAPLPIVQRHADDVLAFDVAGQRETELRYQHFSVVMRASRRLCFFSAVNIDGSRPVPASRKRWRLDPRIAAESQIIKECYGNPPRFSRGHMTRRNDPSWGSESEGKRGNRDSMHVTNAAPQMQAFNSPIWLELEDYALRNAVKDGMKVSVFSGPFFRADDPVFFNVQVPISFWKVIAFIHDQTGQLCATGYRMNQRQSLPTEEEFVFGAFTSSHLGIATQVSIRSIEEEAGISFGGLADIDPLGTEESITGRSQPRPVLSLNHIRYI